MPHYLRSILRSLFMSSSHKHGFDESTWPFAEPVNAASFTTRHVLDGSRPVLEVFHDQDGAWQILCGTTVEAEDLKLVCLGCMVESHPELALLADLPPGWCVIRSDPSQPWLRDAFEEESDEAEDRVQEEVHRPRMTQPEFDAFVDSAMQELQHKQEQLDSVHGFGGFARWFFDQETEKLEMFDASGRKALEADVIDIGSFASNSQSWKWAWSNSSVLPSLREKALPLKELSGATGRQLFCIADAFLLDGECMAWELAAVSVKHLDALGLYRAPHDAGRLSTFLAISRIRHL